MSGVIEEDGKVEFTDTGAKPDSLEQTVAGSTGAAGTASGVITCGDKVWEAYKSLCGILFKSGNYPPPTDDCYANIIPQLLQLTYLKENNNRKALFTLGQLSPENLIQVIKLTQGDYIAETDVANLIRSEMQQGFVSPQITNLFPELRALSQLSANGYYLHLSIGEYQNTLTNPYLLVLCASPEYRPFLSGCIELAEKDGAFAGIDFNAQVNVDTTNHEKEKLGKYVVKYAQQIKQKEILPILQELQRIPVKG